LDPLNKSWAPSNPVSGVTFVPAKSSSSQTTLPSGDVDPIVIAYRLSRRRLRRNRGAGIFRCPAWDTSDLLDD
jgi:hypothetical protein